MIGNTGPLVFCIFCTANNRLERVDGVVFCAIVRTSPYPRSSSIEECDPARNHDPSENSSNPLNLFSYFVRGGVPIGADRDPNDKANTQVLSIV